MTLNPLLHRVILYQQRIGILPPEGWEPSYFEMWNVGTSREKHPWEIENPDKKTIRRTWQLLHGIDTSIPFFVRRRCSLCQSITLWRQTRYRSPGVISSSWICHECSRPTISIEGLTIKPLDESTLMIPDAGKEYIHHLPAGWELFKEKEDRVYFRDCSGVYQGIRKVGEGYSYYCWSCNDKIPKNEVFIGTYHNGNEILFHNVKGHHHKVTLRSTYTTCKAGYCPICEKSVIDPSSFNGYCSKECHKEGMARYAELLGMEQKDDILDSEHLALNVKLEKMLRERNRLYSNLKCYPNDKKLIAERDSLAKSIKEVRLAIRKHLQSSEQ